MTEKSITESKKLFAACNLLRTKMLLMQRGSEGMLCTEKAQEAERKLS